MTNDAHDMSLSALVINRVAHGFSINGKTFIQVTLIVHSRHSVPDSTAQD